MALRPTRLAQANGQTDAGAVLVGHSKLPIQFGKIIITLTGLNTFPIADQTNLPDAQIAKDGFQSLFRIKAVASGIIRYEGSPQHQRLIVMLGNVPLGDTVAKGGK